MIKISKYTIIFIIYLSLIINHSKSSENKILFKVNNEIITSLDILNEVQYLQIINKEFKNIKKEDAFQISKNSLIREKIKEIEIKKIIKDIKIKDQVLNNLILNYFKDLKITSIPEFEKFFLNKNINPNMIRKKITLEMLWNQLIYTKYKKNVKINKQLIINDLKKNDKQSEFLISEILFDINENENLNDKSNVINNSIEKNDFSQTALIYSISNTANKGGKLGWVKESILSKKIFNELKKLKIGEHTNPILVPGGFLILKLIDLRQVKKDFDLDKEIKKIVDEKTNQQLNRFSNIYFNKVKKDTIINEL
ncbi:PPIC-type PPIASE domain protein [Candidatus Pelagibacter sp. HTCC7211]|uniref:peptidylprolyl isomerase n=1 Tax=Pelagibacter sp. (strain HTCC7211) TaxID=439493 RepID=UPI0001839E96|nr:peptidylprolyl isomerase [Candidatus Pelagibacter sp. HTCC7211]EDZ60311.1 PPIC-type PPIASE domain protein [Candidatus Pelagibacter sp. HTCC7211]MBD1151081.1 peptidylprolyl isomerase [Pelagibacterales bacterium SAG-MED25]